MKEFEKWLYNNACNYGIPQNSMQNRFAKAAWCAALEWVKKEAISLDERGDSNRNIINRELGD